MLGPGLDRERKVGTCTRDKVCLRSEWKGRGDGKSVNEREEGSDGSQRREPGMVETGNQSGQRNQRGKDRIKARKK